MGFELQRDISFNELIFDNSFEDEVNQTFFFDNEACRVFKETENVLNGGRVLNQGSWKSVMFEGSSPSLRVDRISKGEYESLLLESSSQKVG